ncbi:hypothetical protein [Thalassotalea sp. G2M2-11]|uniref:hypothetical protein n=1 Tax=Thalassotalea sp. G2M2-11 TaxID=2787627 RepID=UPI0019D13B0D|nr:hypothetical protein [Thalassotalea sp. G2M2-11]
MNEWLALLIIFIALMLIIGNFSTVRRNAKTPLRKKGLNDLEETLPRSNKDNKNTENMKHRSDK